MSCPGHLDKEQSTVVFSNMESGDELDALAYELGPGTSTAAADWGPRALCFAKLKDKKLVAKRLSNVKAGCVGFEAPVGTLDEQIVLVRELLAKWPTFMALPTFSNVEGPCVLLFSSSSHFEDVKFKRWCDSKSCVAREADLDFQKVSQALCYSLSVKFSMDNWTSLCNGELLVQGQDLFLCKGASTMNCVRWSTTVQQDGLVEISVQALQARCSKLELEEIFPSSSMRNAFLTSTTIHEVDASKVLLLPEMTQGWIAWIESSATHPEAAAEYAAFAKSFKAKHGVSLPPKNDFSYNAYVRFLGHMVEPVFYPPSCLRWFFPQPLAHQIETDRQALETDFLQKLKIVCGTALLDLTMEPKFRLAQAMTAAAHDADSLTTVRPKSIFSHRVPSAIERMVAPKPMSPVKHSGPPIVPRFAAVVQSMAKPPKAAIGKASSAKAKAAAVAAPVPKPVAAKKKQAVAAEEAEFDDSIFSPAAALDSSGMMDESSRQSMGDGPAAVPLSDENLAPTVAVNKQMPLFAKKPIAPPAAGDHDPAPGETVKPTKTKSKTKASDTEAGKGGEAAAGEEKVRKKPKIDESVDVFKICLDNKWESVSIPSLREWLNKQGVKAKSKCTKPELVEIAKQYIATKQPAAPTPGGTS
eukprot:m.100081 g.100081  ORF g.100081 m.100081 type:complete len:641 (-) comp14050_c0_seq2:72-1994(-)